MSKISVQMDPIELVDIKADTTFALALEAYKRGHELFYYNPKNLSYNKGIITARGQNIIKMQIFHNYFKFWIVLTKSQPLKE